jgi:hypothetical protein
MLVDDPLSLRRTDRNLQCSVGVSAPQLVPEDAEGVGGYQVAIPDRSSENVRNLRRATIPIRRGRRLPVKHDEQRTRDRIDHGARQPGLGRRTRELVDVVFAPRFRG